MSTSPAETLRIAATALQSHKLRSFLTLLGVIIGVMTVVAVVSIISGLNEFVTTELISLSPDVFVVTQFGIITSREEFLEALKRKRIGAADVEAIERSCKRCGVIGVNLRTSQTVKRESEKLDDVAVVGATASMAQLTNLDLEAGRFFLEAENRHAAPLAVIGSELRDELFAKLDPLGREVWIAGMPYKVIGLLKKQGAVLGHDQDKQVFVPLEAFRKQFGTRRSVGIFIRPAAGMAGLEPTMDEVRTILRVRRKTAFRDKDPFGIVTAGAVDTAWKAISAGAFALVTFISGISLVVGGIVIANIMLVSVVERTHEIGIRRAMGARQRDIHLQFLTEAVMLSLCGGLLGLVLGATIAYALRAGISLPARVTPEIVAAGLAMSIVTGFAAGFFPARKAAKLPPIDALRWE